MANFITKYSPRTLEQFHFDSDFTQMIRIMINLNTVKFLFVGNTGTCKTTLLRAVIREYYGLGATDPLPTNNLLFINSLKEQGINYFRTEMKIFCQSHTNIRGRAKIVIIDDIDTINEQSQQVFRNCMDKYGANVHFIATCTSIQKVIESIQSRLQIMKIPPITKTHLNDIMGHVMQKENISMNQETREFLLTLSENSVRVMMNYLEKMMILLSGAVEKDDREISFELCNKLCTDISFELFEEYTRSLKKSPSDLARAITIFNNIYDYGFSVIDILDNYFTFVKMTDTLTEEEKYRLIPYLCKFITAFHNIHEDSIELVFFTNNVAKCLSSSAGTETAPRVATI